MESLVRQIHNAPRRFVAAMSGGGSGALAQLFRVPGASRTILEAVIPYAEPALVAWLGGRPDQFCSSRTARAMAVVAFRRARVHDDNPEAVAGVACTASLTSDRPKLGPHRAHVALQTAAMTAFWSVELTKGARSRAEEESLVDRLVLNALAEGCSVADRLDLELRPEEAVSAGQTVAPPGWRDLLLGRAEQVCQGRPVDRAHGEGRRALFPGEFNPIHNGHRRMAEIAGQVLGVPVEFEIAITNVDKPPLDYYEIQRRTAQFDPAQAVWLTRAPRFTDKARLFPGATFVVGVDTLRRIAAPRYYGDAPAACSAAIEWIASRGCRFLVFGRNLGTGFVSVGDLDLPPALVALCREVPADQFREDVSSTAIRRSGGW